MKKKKLLDNHLLFQSLMKNLKPSLERGLDLIKKTPDGAEKFLNYELQVLYSEKEEYHLNVFKCCSNIQDTLVRINAIAIYTSAFPTTKKYLKQGITKKDWITYHYANYELAKVSIYDMVLLLVNQLFTLGLRPQNCNNDTVRQNKWIKKSKNIAAIIDELEKVTKENRNPKNLFVHRGITPRLEYIDLLNLIEYTSSYAEIGFSTSTIKRIFKMAFKEIEEEIKKDLDILEKIINNLFDALLIEYNSRSESS